MSRIIALIENSTVVNVIVADSWPGGIDVTDLSPGPGPGWTYDGQNFIAPSPAVLPLDYGTNITKLAFRQRIGQLALIAIELASIHDPSSSAQQQQIAASLRVMKEDLLSAMYIDLSNINTRNSILQLEQYGFLGQGQGLIILDTPVQEHEVPLFSSLNTI